MTPWRGGGLVGLPRACGDLQAVGYEWHYNWSPTPSCPNAGVPFVPMVKNPWRGDLPWNLDGGPNQSLLTFNEPDSTALTPERALQLWPQLEATGRKLGSPAVTATAKGASWLAAFMAGARAQGRRVDFLAAHWYGTDTANLVGYLAQLHTRYGLPVWLTEFCCFNGSLAANTRFAQEVGPMLAALPYLQRVGWFCNRALAGGYEHSGLVDAAGALTPVGRAYKAWQK